MPSVQGPSPLPPLPVAAPNPDPPVPFELPATPNPEPLDERTDPEHEARKSNAMNGQRMKGFSSELTPTTSMSTAFPSPVKTERSKDAVFASRTHPIIRFPLSRLLGGIRPTSHACTPPLAPLRRVRNFRGFGARGARD